ARITLQTPEGEKTVPLDRVMRVAPKKRPTVGAPSGVRVELVDGSVVLGNTFTVDKGQAVLTRGKETLTIPARDLRCVQLGKLDDKTAAQWNRLVDEASTADGDRLITRKGDALNYHDGLLGDVTDDRVSFTLDEQVLPVKRSKVFGLIYRQPAGRKLEKTLGQLTEASGANWAVAAMSLKDGALQVTTPAGLDVAVPLEQLVQLDFSQGKIVYLGDLKPESVRFWPYFGDPKNVPQRAEFFRPRSDRALSPDPLRLGGKEYTKGLAVHSRTQVEYLLPGAFSRLKAIVGIDDRARPAGHVRLEIRGDDRVLYERAFGGSDPPEALDVDLSGVRRLTILVDFGNGLDVADHLDLCDARIVK
ncbi:MAG: NPCBM/NEW2 domain-containing protein, partial [Pirellulales bacterium]|nr:NPCBM/NEW2 domain-containing protein [Pirellulales bacterium]